MYLMKKYINILVCSVILCLAFTSCSKGSNTADTADPVLTEYPVIDWRDDPDIGTVQPGYYKRIGIVKDGETYEEMLKLRETESKGILIVNDDGSAVFDLDGNITEYVYDEYRFYLAQDSEKTNGIPYTFIKERIITDDGNTITQYLKLSDEELEAYLGSQSK